MRKKPVVFILLGVFLAVVLGGCGGGGGGTPNVAPVAPQLSLNASRNVGLADNADTITLTAAGTDGAQVNFTVTSGTATLGSNSATISGGVATTTIKSGAVGTVNITATSGTSTGTTSVKFIPQPTAMDVFVALSPAQPSLASLQFSLVNTAGATATTSSATAINAAATGSIIAAAPGLAPNTTTVGLANATGFNTTTLPIIKITYAVNSGLPGVLVDASGISALNASLQPISLTPQNFVITVEYR